MDTPVSLGGGLWPTPFRTAWGAAAWRVALWTAAAGLLAVTAACVSSEPTNNQVDPVVRNQYSAVNESAYHVPAANLAKIDRRFYRQKVATPPTINEPAGTLVVDPAERFLYLVETDGMSMRYGIGVGREGFAWTGAAVIHDKTAWPKWFPPAEMIARDPKLAPFADGMDGGIKNPLGARALYLWQANKDTLYRLHGTNDPSSIGHAVSSGCIRLLNQDIIDVYNRVPLGTRSSSCPRSTRAPGPSISRIILSLPSSLRSRKPASRARPYVVQRIGVGCAVVTPIDDECRTYRRSSMVMDGSFGPTDKRGGVLMRSIWAMSLILLWLRERRRAGKRPRFHRRLVRHVSQITLGRVTAATLGQGNPGHL